MIQSIWNGKLLRMAVALVCLLAQQTCYADPQPAMSAPAEWKVRQLFDGSRECPAINGAFEADGIRAQVGYYQGRAAQFREAWPAVPRSAKLHSVSIETAEGHKLHVSGSDGNNSFDLMNVDASEKLKIACRDGAYRLTLTDYFHSMHAGKIRHFQSYDVFLTEDGTLAIHQFESYASVSLIFKAIGDHPSSTENWFAFKRLADN